MKRKIGYLYLARSIDGAYLKVGYTANPHDRLRQLQPEAKRIIGQKLVMVGFLSCYPETELAMRRTIEAIMSIDPRRKLPSGRGAHEWYETTPELERYIQGLPLIPVEEIPNPKKWWIARIAANKAKPPVSMPRCAQIDKPACEPIDPEILAYFRECGSKGGKTSAANMTPEARSKRAKIAVDARIAKVRDKSTA